jgi:hypothetical protein
MTGRYGDRRSPRLWKDQSGFWSRPSMLISKLSLGIERRCQIRNISHYSRDNGYVGWAERVYVWIGALDPVTDFRRYQNVAWLGQIGKVLGKSSNGWPLLNVIKRHDIRPADLCVMWLGIIDAILYCSRIRRDWHCRTHWTVKQGIRDSNRRQWSWAVNQSM